MNRKRKSPSEDRLILELNTQDSSTKPTTLTTSRNGKIFLKQIAQRWSDRGYYPNPSAAMRVLLEGLE